jgi:hypothetical protein
LVRYDEAVELNAFLNGKAPPKPAPGYRTNEVPPISMPGRCAPRSVPFGYEIKLSFIFGINEKIRMLTNSPSAEGIIVCQVLSADR